MRLCCTQVRILYLYITNTIVVFLEQLIVPHRVKEVHAYCGLLGEMPCGPLGGPENESNMFLQDAETTYKTTWHHNSEYHNRHLQGCENLKFLKIHVIMKHNIYYDNQKSVPTDRIINHSIKYY
jgi:hypothetical protein